jgi:hypothetical protein
VEWDDAEEKLNEIMAVVEQQEDGLFKYQGRLLQMLTEGGGWFDCRRPAYYGTNSKSSKLVTARQPLVTDPELDYSYESDADWSGTKSFLECIRTFVHRKSCLSYVDMPALY